MLSPLLIIGVGGSGGKTIRAMKQAIQRRLDSVRYTGGIPDAWQFLQIDTTYDGTNFGAPMLPMEEFHQVVARGADFYSIKKSLENLGTLHERQQLLAGWGIPYSEVPVHKGAGQMRGIGRQVGVANALQILGAIRNSISKMNSPTAMSELGRVARVLGDETAPDSTPAAFIIASLAGGSGAGMFLDIAELLKRADTESWVSRATSFLYTAEVFESLGTAGADVRKNSLGAMNEIVAGKWNGLTERSSLLFEKLGIPDYGGDTDTFGCKVNFLVGARNASGIDISKSTDGAGMDEVFMTIGEALAGAMTDVQIAEWLINISIVNISSRNSANDKSGLAPESGKSTLPFAGIGFGRMSLGADRIVDYVADALTRRQLEKLLWPEMNPELLKNGQTTASLVSEKASELWPTFLLESGLDEKGSQNQVIDELYPENQDTDVTGFATKVISSSVSNTPKPLANFTMNAWSEWETESPRFFTQMKEKIQVKAQAWVPSIQEKLRDRIADELVTNGFFVVSDLLDRLIDELTEYAVPELKREHRELSTAIQGFNQASFAERVKSAAEGLSGVSTENLDFLNKIRNDLKRVSNYRIQSYICELASSLIVDMLQYFFEPLKKEIATARYNLDSQRRKDVLDNGQTNPLKYFPDWGSGIISPRYKPRTIERILIDPEEYETVYKHYAAKDTGSSQPFEKSINFALLGRLMNLAPGQSNPQTLVTIDNPWSTGVADAKALGAAATKLQISFHSDLLELSERNRQWLKNDKTQFGQFTNMSIREFVNVDGDPELRNKREQQFVAAFNAMLGLAQPLIKLNNNAMNYVINVDDYQPAKKLMSESSKIPFDISSNVGRQCINILKENGIDITQQSLEGEWFDPADNATTMYAISTTQASLPAWAFESLTAPIAEQAAQAKLDAGTWSQFWENRQGRPLQEAVPFSAEIRQSIITGWFVSSIFNLVELETSNVGRVVKIWNPTLTKPAWSTFPAPLLPRPKHQKHKANEKWVLPSLLTSAGLAFVEFGQTGSLESLYGYRLLKYLGREVTVYMERDQWDASGAGDELPTKQRSESTYIRNWVENGSRPDASRDLHKLLQQKVEMQTDRKGALISTIETIQSEYQSAWLSLDTVEWYELPHTWELKDDINLALNDLKQYVENLNDMTSGPTSI